MLRVHLVDSDVLGRPLTLDGRRSMSVNAVFPVFGSRDGAITSAGMAVEVTLEVLRPREEPADPGCTRDAQRTCK